MKSWMEGMIVGTFSSAEIKVTYSMGVEYYITTMSNYV